MINDSDTIADIKFMFSKIRNLSGAIIDLQSYILETEALHDNKVASSGLIKSFFTIQEIEADLKMAFIERFMEKTTEWDQEKLKEYKESLYKYRQDSYVANIRR